MVGFGFQENEDPHEYAHHKENACKDRVAMGKAATSLHKEYRPPLVYVQLDSAAKTGGDFEGIKGFKDEYGKDLKGVVCFSAIPQDSKLDSKWIRWIHPLVLAHASTYHKAQGLTLGNGVVMQPPALSSNSHTGGPELGLAYVGISRVKRTDGPSGLTLLSPLQEKHFTSRPQKRYFIRQEYERLHSLPGAF